MSEGLQAARTSKIIWQTFGIRTFLADIDDAVSVMHIFYLVRPLYRSVRSSDASG